MKSIDIFYQGEGLREIEHLEAAPDQTFAEIKALLIERHGLHAEVLIFLEDSNEPINELIVIREHAGQHQHAGYDYEARRVGRLLFQSALGSRFRRPLLLRLAFSIHIGSHRSRFGEGDRQRLRAGPLHSGKSGGELRCDDHRHRSER